MKDQKVQYAMGLLLLIGGLALLIWQFRPSESGQRGMDSIRAQIQRRIQDRMKLQSRLVVQEVDIKDLAYVQYRPSMLNKAKMMRLKRIDTVWEHRSSLPFYIDLEQVSFKLDADSSGEIRGMTVVLPTPVCDEAYANNLSVDGFRYREGNCALHEIKEVSMDVENFARAQFLGDLGQFVRDGAFLNEARAAARIVITQFYKNIVPGLDVTVRFSDEAVLRDAAL